MVLLRIGANRGIIRLRDMRSAMVFAFCVSSSNAAIPVVMRRQEQIKITPIHCEFVIPWGLLSTWMVLRLCKVSPIYCNGIDIGLLLCDSGADGNTGVY